MIAFEKLTRKLPQWTMRGNFIKESQSLKDYGAKIPKKLLKYGGKEMKKKWITVTAAMMAAIMCMIACGTTTTEESSKKEAETEGNESAENTEDAEASADEGEELEYVKLKIISVGVENTESSQVFLEKVNEMLLRDLNCEVEIQNIPTSDVSTKYPLVLSSGEEFDIIYASRWAGYSSYASKGAYMELTEEMIETYMPRTWEAAADRLDEVKVNGKIYLIPRTGAAYNDHTFVGVRGDIMEEAGLEEITSMQDLEVYLDYVVANHPEMDALNINAYDNGGNTGIMACLALEDETGFYYVSDDHVVGLAGLAKQFTGPYILDISDPSDVKYYDEDVVDEYCIKWMKKTQEWQQSGYWADDCLSTNSAPESYYITGNGAAVNRAGSSVESYVRTLQSVDPDADARIYRLTDNYNMVISHGTADGIAINASSKNAERAMMVCDLFGYEQEYVDLLQYGIEGIHYNLTEDGSVELIDDPEYEWSVPTYMGFQTSAARKNAEVLPEFRELEEQYGGENSESPVIRNFSFDSSSVSNEYAAINEVNTKYMGIMKTGLAEDVETYYYEYKEAMKTAGLDVVLEEQLKQLQAFYDSLD